MKFTFLAAVVAAAVLTAAPALAQAPKTLNATVSETFTITAIDHTSRVVTLKGKGELTDDIYCGPEVQRFNELKVGDRVTFTYRESVVMALRRAGSVPAPSSAAVTRSTGAAPGATIASQQVATVTVTAIDTTTPAVTLKTSDGRIKSMKVEDKKNLEGIKVGDIVDVTYTQALAISVTPAK